MIIADKPRKIKDSDSIVRHFSLIDSEILRQPFNKQYGHAQDQKIRDGLEKLDKVLKKTRLFCYTDYSKLPKNNLFTPKQGGYASQFLLNLFSKLNGCFFFSSVSDKEHVFLYLKNGDNELECDELRERNRFSSLGQVEIKITIPEGTRWEQAIINYLIPGADNNSILLISNDQKFESIASNNSIPYQYGDSWVEALLKSDYG